MFTYSALLYLMVAETRVIWITWVLFSFVPSLFGYLGDVYHCHDLVELGYILHAGWIMMIWNVPANTRFEKEVHQYCVTALVMGGLMTAWLKWKLKKDMPDGAVIWCHVGLSVLVKLVVFMGMKG